ncbi:hypothetical protein DL770_009703 [Monosporascus sp. CRB-9-2]|nr:hypothetical protein DL770_009703 [Monosporascus sp. CRB-9-2]
MSPQEPVPIAIIGMGCRFPGGANSPEALWKLLAEGRSAWREFPKERFNWDAFYHPHPEVGGVSINHKGGHYLDQDIAAFDAGFFGVSRLEAENLDPQQRLVLESSWEAFENAGIPMDTLRGSNTSVYVAMFGNDFEHGITRDPLSLNKYHCTGSLVALNLACQSLRSGESDMALAGGVGLVFSPEAMAILAMPGLFNSEGRCFAFDDRGGGYGRGEGVGMIAMKRLDDAIRDGDNIRAIIRNSAANQDGRTNGITLPSQVAQERLGRRTFKDLAFAPHEVQYAEAHGTGTKAGDLAELRAIHNVFCEGRPADRPLYVGTAKPNIGHTESASGAAGLIKAIVSMEKGLIPPLILLENLKPGLDPENWNIRISKELVPWPHTTSTRKAVINSFGVGGTNAMVVLESPDNVHKHHHIGNGGSALAAPRLFTLSARSEYSLIHGIEDLREHIKDRDDVDLDGLSYTLTARRSNFPWRSSILATNISSLINALCVQECNPAKAPAQVASVFVFTGQGASYAQMGYTMLSTHTEFSRSIQRSDQVLRSLGAPWSLVEELSRDQTASRLNDSRFGQPASTAIQVALVDLMRSWSVHPTAVIGHSSGEIAAAYAAGALTHDNAIRAAYHRSFLAEAAKKVASQSGAMMAVGIGEEEAKDYISKLNSSKAVVACVNSPSSTTISGDYPAVWELKETLEKKGIFARLLKVDTAYHSHHMEAVGGEYMDRLAGLEASSLQGGSVRFFSTVTEQEETEGFGASYWVKNLVSKVRFSGAIQQLARELGSQASLNFIELGPHKALAGPVRQSLAPLHGDSFSYNYIPTLVRGENDVRALMETGSALFKAGSDVNTSVVASLGISTPSPRMVKDLPPYHWNHTTLHWEESRLSREYRHRRHPHHDLLGSRILTSPDSEPSWRTYLGVDSLPWLKHHSVNGFVVFPGAGYITMAVEAMKQLNDVRHPDAEVEGYRLKNVAFNKALLLSADSRRVEVVLNFRQSSLNDDTYHFSVFSVSDQGNWLKNCDGTISAVLKAGTEENDQCREADIRLHAHLDNLKNAQETCTECVDHNALYAGLGSRGNQFGPTFSNVNSARVANSKSLATVTIPDIAACMPGKFMQPHIIHPTLYDALIHTCVYQFKKQASPGSAMLTFYGETYISADITSQPGEQLQVVSDTFDTFSHSTNYNLVAFQEDVSGNPRPVLTVTKGEVRIIAASDDSTSVSENNIFKLEWGLDVRSVTPDVLECIATPLQCDEAGLSQADKLGALHAACARYIDWSIRDIKERGLTIPNDHRSNLFQWMVDYIKSSAGQAMLKSSPETEEEILRQLSGLGVEGELITRFGPKMTSMLIGETDALALFLEDNLLYRVYHTDDSGRGNGYLSEYAKKLTFQNSSLRILELGAGTGSATAQLLRSCSPSGEPFCEEYMYTDISSGFFETARTTIVKDWAHLLTFRTLDLEHDPVEQGFEEHAYDFILASNVVHATKSLKKTLGNIHRLLKPGGVLGLVELIKETPYHNMTFGLLSGWWLGVHEGRKTTPLQTVDQWNQHFVNSSFSGVDLAAYDFPEPARGAAFITSSALPATAANGSHVNGKGLPHIEILDATSGRRPGDSIRADLLDALDAKGFASSVRDFSDTGIDTSTSYVILDSADNLILNNASPQQFSHITSLLTWCSKVYWITFADGQASIVPDSSLVTGLARTARIESENLKFITLDVQDSFDNNRPQLVRIVSDFIASAEKKIAAAQPLELDNMYRNGKFHIQRYVSDSKLNKVLSSSPGQTETEECAFHHLDRPLRAHVEKPGLLNSITFVDDDTPELGEDDVEIESHAWGVNFKDVFCALGQMKATATMVGEGAGVVTRTGPNMASKYKPGDRVAVLFGTPFASRTRTNGNFIHPISDTLTLTDAASIPVAYCSAVYALMDIANLRRGQTVLIHAAMSDLGKAAIRVAQDVGAIIFATVNSAAKRQFLIDQYCISEEHIFSNLPTEFAAGIMRLTNGEGVDVVLNTLTGDGLQASWECVAKLGTFIETGKTDIYRRSRLSMEPFDRSVRFASVDLAVLAKHRPKYVQELLQRVFSQVEAGSFSPLPVTTLPISDIEKAFRLVQSEKSQEKVVLESDPSTVVTARVQQLRLHNNKTYVIVGGLGTLGRHLTSHLQDLGARNIAIVTRKQLDHDARTSLETELSQKPGSVVQVMTCDITDQNEVLNLAARLGEALPPVAGVLQGAMVLSMTLSEFQDVIKPKVQGTKYLADAFTTESLDFFVLLSSLAGVLGTPSQANYAASSTFQNMFAHSKAFSGCNKFISLDLPLIEGTHWISEERAAWLARQGGQTVPMGTVLSVLDYAMSGRAFKDGFAQIAFGLSPQYLQERAKNGSHIAPLLRNLCARDNRDAGSRAERKVERSVESLVAQAPTVQDAEKVMLEAIRDRISSLTAGDVSEISLDSPLVNLGLDSLIAIEIKNWITSTLQAPTQVGEILDSPNLRALASLVTERSGLVKKTDKTAAVNGHQPAPEAMTNGQVVNGKSPKKPKSKEGVVTIRDDVQLPKLPLQPLEATMEVFLESISYLGSEKELEGTRQAIAEFLSPGGLGRRLQARLEKIANDPSVDNWLSDIYINGLWLKTRNNSPRLNNFFGTHRLSKYPQSQAERAALISLAAYSYKLSLDNGAVKRDYLNEQPLCMESVYWLFNTSRTPSVGCDRVGRWPGNDYLVAMRHGHVYKVPLRGQNGNIVSHDRLKAIRDKMMLTSPTNKEFISSIEQSLFAVCFDDSAPENSKERGDAFMKDDSTNRWLDKTVSFIICSNGASATFYEHSAIDGLTVYGLQEAIASATVNHIESDREVSSADIQAAAEGLTYLPFSTTDELTKHMTRLRAQHCATMSSYSLCIYEFKDYGAAYLRSQKMPPQSIFQMVIQVAVRRHFGYNPMSLDVVGLRQFLHGRVETFNVQTAEVAAFCAAAEDEAISAAERKRLLSRAVKSHARFVTLTARGRSWTRHLMALREVMEPGEELPALYDDPVYGRTKERKVFTNFGGDSDGAFPEQGTCWADKSALWIACEVTNDGARFNIINGEGRGEEFAKHLEGAAKVVKGIIAASV